MASKNLTKSVKALEAVRPQAISSNTTVTGATIDTSLYESVGFLVHAGTLTDGAYAVTVYGGDASDMSDEAAAATADLVGSAVSFASTDDDVVKKIGYVGAKRYVRIKIVSTSVTTGGTIGAIGLLGHPRSAPVS